jgi:hypothetical protein
LVGTLHNHPGRIGESLVPYTNRVKHDMALSPIWLFRKLPYNLWLSQFDRIFLRVMQAIAPTVRIRPRANLDHDCRRSAHLSRSRARKFTIQNLWPSPKYGHSKGAKGGSWLLLPIRSFRDIIRVRLILDGEFCELHSPRIFGFQRVVSE